MPVRTRGCKKCKGKGYRLMHSMRNKKVDTPMGEVTIADKVPCDECCLHNGPVIQTPEPDTRRSTDQPFTASATCLRINCGRCGAYLERRPIIVGGKASTARVEALTQVAQPTPANETEPADRPPVRRSKRRRKVARRARNRVNPGLPYDDSHLVLHYASYWDDTVRASIRWRIPSKSMQGAMNIGLDFERPLNMADGTPSKDGAFSIITMLPDGKVHPSWVTIVEGP